MKACKSIFYQPRGSALTALFLIFSLYASAIIKPVNFDLQEFINIEINARKNPVIIPPGVYRLKPVDRQHLLFKNLRNLTIIADSVEIVCSETTRAISFENCENVTLRGLTIDYDPLCFTQGKIIRMSEDKSEIEFKLDENYPRNFEKRIEIFDSKTLTLKRASYYSWSDFVKTGNGTYKINKGSKYKYNPEVDKEELGDILVTNNISFPNGYMPHAVMNNECRNLKLENITLYSSNCFGFFETNGTKNVYLNCRIDRPTTEHDLYKRSQRIRSTNADAYHSKYAYVGPQIIGCSARFQGDDCVNICGKYYYSSGSKGNVIYIIPTDRLDLTVGSVLEIITAEGVKMREYKVLKIEESGIPSNSDIQSLLPLKIKDSFKDGIKSPTAKLFQLTVDREIDLKPGALIGDKNRMGRGFLVKDCDFGFNRSRGILIKASDGKIVGNKLEENWMPSILITPEAFWMESGCSDNLEISDNQIIKNKASKAITIDGRSTSGLLAGPGLHNNINIVNNRFVDCLSPAIYISVTKGLNINGNSFINPIIDGNSKVTKQLLMEKCSDVNSDI